jgi:hypothetical protein
MQSQRMRPARQTERATNADGGTDMQFVPHEPAAVIYGCRATVGIANARAAVTVTSLIKHHIVNTQLPRVLSSLSTNTSAAPFSAPASTRLSPAAAAAAAAVLSVQCSD